MDILGSEKSEKSEKFDKSDKSDKPLSHRWNFYDHIKCDQNNYDQSTSKIGTCSTIFEFWTCYEKLPKPSQIFYQKECGKPFYYKNDVKREISSLSVFKDPILPKWEDPVNKTGGEIEYRIKADTSIEFVDKLWLYLCIYCLSDNFVNRETSSGITGFRLVDSSIPSQNKALYRVEIWFDNLSMANSVEKRFRNIFELHGPEHKITTKKHLFT
jgi:hypothetical protein